MPAVPSYGTPHFSKHLLIFCLEGKKRIALILQMRRLRFGKVKWLAQSHSAGKWLMKWGFKSRSFNPVLLPSQTTSCGLPVAWTFISFVEVGVSIHCSELPHLNFVSESIYLSNDLFQRNPESSLFLLPLEVCLFGGERWRGPGGKGREDQQGIFPVFHWMRPKSRESETHPWFFWHSEHWPNLCSLLSHSPGMASKCGGV